MYTVTDMKCPMCYDSYLVYYQVGHPSSFSFREWCECGKCGYNPDKDKEEVDHEDGKGIE